MFDLAERDGKVAANPCRCGAARQGRKRQTWTRRGGAAFLAAAAGDRLAAAWLLSLLGLRRAEVLGLRWSGVSFTDGTLTVSSTRVLVDAKVIEKGPKSERGHRTLPLFPAVTAALEALYKTQMAERAAAGSAYAGDVDGGYVCADELGAPLHPERYSDEFGRLCALAGLPKFRLHDCRHSTTACWKSWACRTASAPGGSATRWRSTRAPTPTHRPPTSA